MEVQTRRRDSPGDSSLLEVDTSKELSADQGKLYRESVGRLLYLSHTRPDIQFTTCVLSGQMQNPTVNAMKMLQKVVQYLASTPEIGFVVIKPARDEACFGYSGKADLRSSGTLVVESITDSDWAGCRKTRRAHPRSSSLLRAALWGQWSDLSGRSA